MEFVQFQQDLMEMIKLSSSYTFDGELGFEARQMTARGSRDN
jgi:hypothetical protein